MLLKIKTNLIGGLFSSIFVLMPAPGGNAPYHFTLILSYSELVITHG